MNRERFYLYIEDYNSCINRLSQEQKGALLDEVFLYMRDGTIPKDSDPLLDMAFSVVKNKLDKDTARYNETCAVRRKVGALGGKTKAANKSAEATKKNTKNLEPPPMSNRPSVIRKQLAVTPRQEREEAFAKEVYTETNMAKYGKETLDKFYAWATELITSCNLMRFEDFRYDTNHGSFEVNRRLARWKINGEEYKRKAQESKLQAQKAEEAKITSFIKEDDKV